MFFLSCYELNEKFSVERRGGLIQQHESLLVSRPLTIIIYNNNIIININIILLPNLNCGLNVRLSCTIQINHSRLQYNYNLDRLLLCAQTSECFLVIKNLQENLEPMMKYVIRMSQKLFCQIDLQIHNNHVGDQNEYVSKTVIS